ncbi:MAG: hypothetical protein IPI96_15115 [Saprospiraceae bacterium]|nr:hypothetical protein [Saprospiraceae bacterium]
MRSIPGIGEIIYYAFITEIGEIKDLAPFKHLIRLLDFLSNRT